MKRDEFRDATWRPISEETRAAHQAAINEAIATAPTPTAPLMRPRRRLVTVAVTAALLVLPAGMALAAENALPGDVLYPVKKITEQIRSLVDDDVVAEHRIEELEQLVAGDAPADVIAEQVDRAAAEVDRLEPDNHLRPRFATATDAVGDRPRPDDEVIADPPPVTETTVVDTPTTVVTDTTLPPTTDTTTPTTVIDRPDRTTTTTTVVDTTTTLPPDVTTVLVVGVVKSGPTCPVQQFPPRDECEDRPVSGAVLVIADADGKEITRVETTEEGRFELRLPTGSYQLIPQPYEGLLGTADRQEFTIAGDGLFELFVGYDTGIR